MSEAMNTMEKLLHEADGKFNEKLRLCQGGIATNMNIYSDRTYNLRQQVLHNPQLTSDDHFMEMLMDTEQALAPEFTLRGEVDKKLTSLLCGLLKTLLREAIGQPLFALRKIQIEMIWQWFQDKKRSVLDFAIGLMKQQSSAALNTIEASDNGLSVTGVGARVQPLESAAIAASTCSSQQTSGAPNGDSKYGSRLKSFIGGTAAAKSAPSSHHFMTANNDLSVRDDLSAADARYATTAKKLTMYKKRNLSKAEKLRQELHEQQQQQAGQTVDGSGVKVVYNKDAKTRQRKVSEARQQLVAMRHGPSGPPSYIHHESTAPFFTRDATEAAALDNAVGNAHQHLVKYFAARMSDEGDRRDLRDTMSLYDFNRSRLDEESNRRLESEGFASQLGRTHHLHLRKTGSIPAGDGATTTDAKPGRMHFNIGATVKPSSGSSTLPPTAEQQQSLLGVRSYQGPASSTLSPYDHRHITRLDEVKLQAFMQRYSREEGTTTAPAAGVSVSQLTPMTQPKALNTMGTPCCGLDVALAPDAKVTAVGPRIDTPVMDLLFESSEPHAGVPSQRKIEELKIAARVREAFASDRKPGQRPGSAHHYPRSKIERAMVTPDDHATSDCMRLLPTYGSFLPRRPSTAKR